MTLFTPEELEANVRLNLGPETPAGTLILDSERGYASPSRAVYSLQDCIKNDWFGLVLDTIGRRTGYLTKVLVTFQNLWETAKHYHQNSEQQKARAEELLGKLQDAENANHSVVQAGILREQQIRSAAQNELQECNQKLTAALEARGQLETLLTELSNKDLSKQRVLEELDELRAAKVLLDGQHAAAVQEIRRVTEEAARNKESREREIIRLNLQLAKERVTALSEDDISEDEKPTPRGPPREFR
jgi:hypothetical protein